MTREEFRELYLTCLHEAIVKYPQDYRYFTEPTVIHGNTGTTRLEAHTPEQTVDKMMVAMEQGTYSKDSHAIKAICQALKIPHTYKALQSVIAGWRA